MASEQDDGGATTCRPSMSSSSSSSSSSNRTMENCYTLSSGGGDNEAVKGPNPKRPRIMRSWEARLERNTNTGASRKKAAGGTSSGLLAQLFCRPSASDGDYTSSGTDANNRAAAASADVFPRPPRPIAHHAPHQSQPTQQQQQQNDGSFTFRLEHRTTDKLGALAKHRGEERILLFRSDRPGAVAKIIYSSEGVGKVAASDRASSSSVGNNASSGPANNNRSKENEDMEAKEEAELRQMIQARIHVLDVKEGYRGRDLGGLLFNEAIIKLRDRYVCHDGKSAVRCQLDAEEDVRRHNKLVDFYQQLGCTVKPNVRVQYINNNDGETYRKIPMQIALRPTDNHAQAKNAHHYKYDNDVDQAAATSAVTSATAIPQHNDMEAEEQQQQHHHHHHQNTRHKHHITKDKSLVGQGGGFLPIHLLEASGSRISFPTPPERERRRAAEWILVDDGEGRVHFRTVQGDLLVVTCDGQVKILSGDEEDVECDVEECPGCCCGKNGSSEINIPHLSEHELFNFSLYRIPDDDRSARIVSDAEESDDEGGSPPSTTRQKELWVLRTARGAFLATDPFTHCLSCTLAPTFWQADCDELSLRCTTDTPPRRIHYRNSWLKQTVERVTTMRNKFFKFNLRTMRLKDALDMAASVTFDPFCVDNSKSGLSVRTFCFRAAESFRQAGHPDWMQLVALIHELGRILILLDAESAAEAEDSGYDWTVSCRSRVVGCRAPSQASFDEFRFLCPDEADSRYNTPRGVYEDRCGLENVMMSWTGPEYLYFMLRHIDVPLPHEAFAMIRLFPLFDWHHHSEYKGLANEGDEFVQMYVSEFDELRRKARRECSRAKDLSDADCEQLWTNVYEGIAAKYGCDGDLSW